MGTIKKLSEDVVASIAAGEVIERPAFVVKELLDNAIDAGATEITITIENYGLDLIEVSDNGQGMSNDDLLLSFQPHTTSKLHEINDLHTIKTLGFRGEALSSIASVSELQIASKKEGSEYGNKVTIKEGSTTVTSQGMKTGTTVRVLHLFENIPARKKFLKSPLVELRLISDVVTHAIFAHPKISFTFIHNKRTLLNENSSSLPNRLQSVWGEEFMMHALPFSTESNFLTVSGFIGKPQLSSTTAQKLWIYVNNRKVDDKLILTAVRDAFGPLLMARSYPTGILFLTVPPEFVDINVHPTKREVRFVHAQQLFQDMKDAVVDLLSKNNLTYYNVGFKTGMPSLKEDLRKEVQDSEIAKLGIVQSNEVLQLHQSFLVSETKKGFQIIDQHAAHESLLYFEFLNAWEKKRKKNTSISLGTPEIITLTVNDDLLFSEHSEVLHTLGFVIEPFGDRSYRVLSVPQYYIDQDIQTVVSTLLQSLSEEGNKLTQKEHLMLATLACKSAIKAGQFLTAEQRQSLVQKLTEKHYAYTCPHGRPVKIEISLQNITHLFKR